MTTPQTILYNLQHSLGRVCQLLEGDEDNGNVVERLEQIELQQDDLMCSQKRLENLMNLIVKFLGKDQPTQSCVNSNTTQDCVNKG